MQSEYYTVTIIKTDYNNYFWCNFLYFSFGIIFDKGLQKMYRLWKFQFVLIHFRISKIGLTWNSQNQQKMEME